jgi:hypothetical protein
MTHAERRVGALKQALRQALKQALRQVLKQALKQALKHLPLMMVSLVRREVDMV